MKLIAFLPEIAVCGLAFLLLLLEVLGLGRKKTAFYTASLGLLLVFPLLYLAHDFRLEYFGGFYILDNMALLFKFLFALLGWLVILLSPYFIEDQTRSYGEYYALLLFALAGTMVLVSAQDLLTLFIAIELISLPLYLLAAWFKGQKISSEAGLKYFLLGAFATGFLLYGISMIYGSFGTLSFKGIFQGMAANPHFTPALLMGILALMVGLGFKIAAAPFHMWAPDVYQGAPTPVVAFLATAPKAAVLVLLIRMFGLAFPALHDFWSMLLLILSGVTMLIGNLTALPQKNLKRLLAFSGIAQIGYLLLGIAAASQAALASTMFYIMIYVLTNLGAFAVLILVSKVTGSDQIKDLRGLSRTAPGLAFILLLALLSLAGIPPLSGFVGKFYLFLAAFEATGPLFKGMVVFAIINSVISLYYYLGVLREVYFEEPAQTEKIPVGFAARIALLVCLFGIVALGLISPVYQWLYNMAKGLGVS